MRLDTAVTSIGVRPDRLDFVLLWTELGRRNSQ